MIFGLIYGFILGCSNGQNNCKFQVIITKYSNKKCPHNEKDRFIRMQALCHRRILRECGRPLGLEEELLH